MSVRKVVITTRRGSGDCYVARAVGLNVTASSTSDPLSAAQRVALKLFLGRSGGCVDSLSFDRRAIKVKLLAASRYQATWEEK